MELAKNIRQRVGYWRRVLLRPWALIVVVSWTLFSHAAVLRDNFLPPDVQQRWTTLTLLPRWDWWVWVLGVLTITVCIVLETSYREWVKQRRDDEAEFRVHGIPVCGKFDGRLYLFVPDVTIVNHSSTQPISIGATLWLLYEPVGMEVYCPAESRAIREWEKEHNAYRGQVLTFPLDLAPRKAAGGYIAFCGDNASGLGNAPRRDEHGYVLTRIEFKDCHSDQTLYQQEISFPA